MLLEQYIFACPKSNWKDFQHKSDVFSDSTIHEEKSA